MIRKPNNWEQVQEYSVREKLPVGAYVCKVKQVNVAHFSTGDQLAILYDIAEGEHTGFYARDFQGQSNDQKKWRGVLRVWIPQDDGSDKDEATKRAFKGMVTSFENSNPGYKWDWNENSLVGKTVGIIYRNEEWEYNGKHGWTAKPLRCMSAAKVRSGDYTIPEDKPLRGDAHDTGYTSAPAGMTAVDDPDLPF
jgi:hypothetical protein